VIGLASFFVYRSSNKNLLKKLTRSPSWKLTYFCSTELDESYILQNLTQINKIGAGGAGIVYKVTLPNEQVIDFVTYVKCGAEYADRLKVSEKSDLYSFGVVILELVSGRKVTNEDEFGDGVNILGWMHNIMQRGGAEWEWGV
ncbi:hypothetical protein KI387_035683, partial [Taxus chinensis]